MSKRFLLLILLFTLVLCGCKVNYAPDQLKIYVLPRDSLSDSMTDSEKVAVAENEGRLAFDGNDIEGYNWQTHTVTLYDTSVSSLGVVTSESGGSSIFKTDDTYAFVLVIKNKLIYVGGFIQGSKNASTPLQPQISDVDGNSFSLTFDSKYAGYADNRSNKTLYSFLNSCGKLSSKTN